MPLTIITKETYRRVDKAIKQVDRLLSIVPARYLPAVETKAAKVSVLLHRTRAIIDFGFSQHKIAGDDKHERGAYFRLDYVRQQIINLDYVWRKIPPSKQKEAATAYKQCRAVICEIRDYLIALRRQKNRPEERG